MRRFIEKIKERDANSLIEYVIILPLIFIVIYALIMTSFIIHDRSTLEAAAKRGAIYAAHCVSDPKYSTILNNSGNASGALDVSVDISEKGKQFSFSGCAKNIQAYRYLFGSGKKIGTNVENEVENIVNETRIPWRTVRVDEVDYTYVNKVIYQDVTVKCTAVYKLPEFFGAFGFDTEIEYTAEAKMAVNDPDEFIRNADLVIDLLTEIDNATGNHATKVINKISEMSSKLIDWLNDK